MGAYHFMAGVEIRDAVPVLRSNSTATAGRRNRDTAEGGERVLTSRRFEAGKGAFYFPLT